MTETRVYVQDETEAVSSLVRELAQEGLRRNTRSLVDYERGKAAMTCWREIRRLDGKARLGYERAIRVVSEYVGV